MCNNNSCHSCQCSANAAQSAVPPVPAAVNPVTGGLSLVLDAGGITEMSMRAGFAKTHFSLGKTILLAVIAGAFVAFGGQTVFAILADATSNGPTKALAGFFFSGALMIIIILGAELFTGNVLILIAVLSKRVYLWEYLFDIVVVYLSNFFGVILFAVIFWGGGLNGYEGSYTSQGTVACKTALGKAELHPYQALLRGIGANMCVCFATMMCHASKTLSGKLLACMFPVASFVVVGLEHSIANMYFYSAATLLRCPGVTQKALWPELFLCTAGNILGAVFLSVSYWYCYIRGTKLQLDRVPARLMDAPEGWWPVPSVHMEEEMQPVIGTSSFAISIPCINAQKPHDSHDRVSAVPMPASSHSDSGPSSPSTAVDVAPPAATAANVNDARHAEPFFFAAAFSSNQ